MNKQEFMDEGKKLFGEDFMKWKFKCPSCGYVASVEDYKKANAPAGAVGFSCIGRWLPGEAQEAFTKGPGPCNYAGGGLFCINTKEVDGKFYFEFAH